jgi:predicted nucleic acid-binding protein
VNAVVIDASVVAKLLLQEDGWQLAAALLATAAELHAPDLIVAEIVNVIKTRVRRGDLTAPAADAALTAFREMALHLHEASPLAHEALRIAIEYDRSGYDALYVALALQLNMTVITADRRLYNAMSTRVVGLVLWYEDAPGR